MCGNRLTVATGDDYVECIAIGVWRALILPIIISCGCDNWVSIQSTLYIGDCGRIGTIRTWSVQWITLVVNVKSNTEIGIVAYCGALVNVVLVGVEDLVSQVSCLLKTVLDICETSRIAVRGYSRLSCL